MKKTITIEIEDNVGVNVYYEKEGEQRKHWSECEPMESTKISLLRASLQQVRK